MVRKIIRFLKDNSGATRLVWIIGAIAGIAIFVALGLTLKGKATNVATSYEKKNLELAQNITPTG